MPKNALRIIRSDPDKGFKSYGFITGKDESGSGPCSVKITKIFSNIFRLDPDFSGRGDYFFPYGRGSSGSVDVPIGQPDGAIAFTAPMNGCSLQVNRTQGNFTFYHDAMSNSMTGKEPGEIVCRVGPKDYDRFDRGSQMIEAERSSKYGGTYGVAIICIHHAGKWKVYSSPVAGPVDKKGNLADAYVFTASVTPWLASFDDE